MLSSEKRPVQTIETDANGLPRWVMVRWRYEPPERLLLLNPGRNLSLCYRNCEVVVVHPQNGAVKRYAPGPVYVTTANLHEIPPPETAHRLPNDGLLMADVLEAPD